MSTLPQDLFDNMRRHMPLVAVDLIIEDPQRRVLLGWRKNEPAKDSWFVPGGRVRKDERLPDAFSRLVQAELGDPTALGVSDRLSDATFAGVFEHLFPVTPTTPFSIHCIILAYRLKATRPEGLTLPETQHRNWRWATVAELLADPQVHPYTRAYYA